MAHIAKDRVKETTTATGTGAITLAGAVTGFRAFSAVMTSPSDTCFYCIDGGTGEWEVGIGTYSAANTLTRTTVLASSNSNNAVNFSAGTKNVFITIPGDKQPANTGVILTASDLYDTAYSSAMDGVSTKAVTPDVVYDKFENLVQPPWVSANFYTPPMMLGACAAGYSLTVDTIYYVPFILFRTTTISDLGARVTTTGSSNFAVAVYANSEATGKPDGAALAATGNILCTSATSITGDITGSNVTLAPGRYWAAFWADNSTVVLMAQADASLTMGGWQSGAVQSTTLVQSATIGGSVCYTSAETYNASAWPNATSETLSITVSGRRSYVPILKAA